jgi:Flp pilus assembly protein TadD
MHAAVSATRFSVHVACLLCAGVALVAQPQVPAPSSSCGSLENGYGPYDFTNASDKRERLSIVETAHFTNDVYELRRGATQASPLGDIDYTLRAFPNHHLALDAMARLHREKGTTRFPDGRYSLECWFERAMRFKPTDGMVPMIYGIHLFLTNDLTNAETYLLQAVKLMPKSSVAHYNAGLLYVRRGNFEAAAQHAREAYKLGAALPGLKDQLARAGHPLTLN